MSISYKTPSYFSTFSCLGGDCEDTCCRDWEVKLDRQHFELLEQAMSKDNNEKSMFENHIHLNDNPITSDHDYANIGMKKNGYCTMFDENRLCSIHAKHGVSCLGNVCTMFPRVVSRCGDTIELSGALSCPEVVRNCIDDTSPLKLKRFKTSDLPRSKNYPIQCELSNLDDDLYSENFDRVRSSLMHVIANEDVDLNTRLYVIANLADKISSFYHRGCTVFSKEKFELSLVALQDDDVVKSLDIKIKEYDSDSLLSMVVVHSILTIKLQQASNENISAIYKKIIGKHNTDDVADALAQELNNVVHKLSGESKQYIDKAVTRYLLNCLYREWFISMPDPFTYVQMLLVRTSILRALIYLYIGEEELDQHQLKQKIVYIIYNFARNIDQNLEFLKVVYNALSEQSMMNFDFSPAFIRVF